MDEGANFGGLGFEWLATRHLQVHKKLTGFFQIVLAHDNAGAQRGLHTLLAHTAGTRMSAASTAAITVATKCCHYCSIVTITTITTSGYCCH